MRAGRWICDLGLFPSVVSAQASSYILLFFCGMMVFDLNWMH